MSQTERVLDILYQLSRDDGSIRLSDIAERYEVSLRQAGRDIEYVRYRIMPSPEMLIYDRQKHAYRLCDGADVLSGWRENMLISFAVMSDMAGSALGRTEIDNALPLSMRKILSHIDYRTPVRSYGDDERHLAAVFEAFEKGRGLIIRYRKTPDSETENRDVDPLKLINYQGFWYLLGYDFSRKGIRTFRLSRAESVIVSLRNASVYDGNEVDDILDSSYGMFIGENPKGALWYTMRFSSSAAVRVSSEIWHSGQKGRWDGNEYELSIPASSPVEVISRLLSYGSDAYPVSPDSFVEAYGEIVREMAEKCSAKLKNPDSSH